MRVCCTYCFATEFYSLNVFGVCINICSSFSFIMVTENDNSRMHLWLSMYLTTKSHHVQIRLEKIPPADPCAPNPWPSLSMPWPRRDTRRVAQRSSQSAPGDQTFLRAGMKDENSHRAVNPEEHRNMTQVTPLKWNSSLECGHPAMHSPLGAGRTFYLTMIRSSWLILKWP